MDKKTKKQWVAALRSGEYKQGKNKLRALASDPETCDPIPGEERFCCLGVLCDLVEPNQWLKQDSEWASGRSGDHNDTGMPRPALQAKLGLDKSVTRTSGANTVADKLAQMNDEGKSFNQIATWIEKHNF